MSSGATHTKRVRRVSEIALTMYVLLNGSFGVGKSHVARELRRSIPDAAIADPEWIGFLLQHFARRHRADYQHDPLWRPT